MLATHQETRSAQSARAVHIALKSALKKMAEAEKCAVICFGEIMARKLYRDLGYSSINHYAEVELGFSPRRTRDFVALSRKLADLPRLKAGVESGKLGYTAARVIAPIVDRTNEQGWVEYATTHSRRDLEREVKTAKREAAETAKGQPTLLPAPKNEDACRRGAGARESGDDPDSVRALRRSVGADSQTRWGAGRSGRGVVGDDAVVCRGERPPGAAQPAHGTTCADPYPPVRRVRSGCNHTRYLEVHHKIPRSQGGTNEPGNLICLCSACHRLAHEKNLAVSWVKSPPAGPPTPRVEPHPPKRYAGPQSLNN